HPFLFQSPRQTTAFSVSLVPLLNVRPNYNVREWRTYAFKQRISPRCSQSYFLSSMKVAVIGAGLSGLTSIKACLDEGLVPICFESSHDIGGLWRFKETPEPGRANIYQSVVINSSKEIMAFSDFPPPAELPNNMHHSEVLLYLRLYAEAFKLLQHIQFQDTSLDHPGQHLCIESFEGKYFHSWDYRSADDMQGKRVVVIGIGNSGGDIAVDISRVAEKVYLSARSGAWVVSRVGEGGLPCDLLGSSRLDMVMEKLFPSWVNKMVENRMPVVNDDLPARIISGRVHLKPNVKQFCGSSVVFVDGSVMDKVDVVVFATGYNYSFPFLPSALQAKSGYRLHLYKHVFPPTLTRPTLAVVGFIRGFGAVNPLAELQARWATRVFKGLSKLPSEETMIKDIDKDTENMHQRFACSDRNPIQVDYIPYLDYLAEQVGVRPNLLWLLLTDPRLALNIILGPCTSYQYRLTGPGQWAGARQAILTQWDRVVQPFKTRVVPEPETKPSSRRSTILILSGAALLCCFYYNKHYPTFFPVTLNNLKTKFYHF
ncbi:Dimethylaniline monooxygenase [N-oxide-forming] 5, partial [Nibea albiflora]